jgi:hypothetical protein
MSEPITGKVVRDEVTTVRQVVTVGPVDGDPLGTFGWFIGIRCRQRDQTKERGRYGTCVICRRRFADDDPIHMVFNVARNGKTVGNRLCCSACAEQHATFHRAGAR